MGAHEDSRLAESIPVIVTSSLMCGIVGIVERDLERPIAQDELVRMVRTLRHRGPDEEGQVVLPETA